MALGPALKEYLLNERGGEEEEGGEGGEGGRVPKLQVLPRKEERRHFLLITRKTERNKLQSRKQPSRPEYKIPTLEGVLGARP